MGCLICLLPHLRFLGPRAARPPAEQLSHSEASDAPMSRLRFTSLTPAARPSFFPSSLNTINQQSDLRGLLKERGRRRHAQIRVSELRSVFLKTDLTWFRSPTAMSFPLRPWCYVMNPSLSSVPSLSSSATTATSSSANPPTATTSTSWFSAIVRGRSDRSGSVKMSGGSGATESSGPIKGKNQFRGLLFKYGPKPVQVGPSESFFPFAVVFV